ncbi:hypothetical protein AAFC00_007105 [Neodothiora populina]|uniref:Uncharacterized protein n=1 Tax=Neodothiora populina TaxID=2781224 RepID=A0ABR3PCA8_9PEZI
MSSTEHYAIPISHAPGASTTSDSRSSSITSIDQPLHHSAILQSVRPAIPMVTITSTQRITAAYRERYAAYLSSIFGISLQAATDEMERQLAPSSSINDPYSQNQQRESTSE